MGRIKNKIKKKVRKFVRYFQKQTPVFIPLIEGNYLNGRTALITGGTSGIGFAMAQAFLRNGANVIVTGRSKEKIEVAIKSLTKDVTKGFVKGFVFDISKTELIEDSFQKLLQDQDVEQIDILINNAGVMDGSPIGDTSIKDFSKTIDTNLKGTFFLSQCVSNYMIEKSIKGNILNIASSSSLRPAISPYMLSKWGIRGLTEGMAKKLIQYGIVVNGIAPGPTLTPMLVTDNELCINNEKVLAGRYCTAEEIANFAVILTSQLGRMIVGDILYVTGGSGLLTYDDMQY